MSADIGVLREIDELMCPMRRDENTEKDKLTAEKLSVALWLGGGPLFLSARAWRRVCDMKTSFRTRSMSSRASNTISFGQERF